MILLPELYRITYRPLGSGDAAAPLGCLMTPPNDVPEEEKQSINRGVFSSEIYIVSYPKNS